MEQEAFCKTCVFPKALGNMARIADSRKLRNMSTTSSFSPIVILALEQP
jgi:hypothetical protein